MEGAVPEFRERLDAIDFRESDTPVYSCVSGAPFQDFGQQLADALTAMVRWRELTIDLYERGARVFIDVGPGKVLAGLVKRTLEDVTILSEKDFVSNGR